MCGIAGIYGLNLSAVDIQAFRNLLMFNVFRGSDSTGAVRVNRKLQTNVLRAVADSVKFVEAPTFKKWSSKDHDPILFLGHCRAATLGAVTKGNTHPFSFPNTIGVMNGTFRGEFRNWLKYSTDSEAIFSNIDELGLVEGLNESMVWDPQFALVWIDKKHGTLNFIKNDKRPLCFTYINNRQALIWSSTRETLEAIIDFHGYQASGFTASDKNKYFDIHENDLLQIKLGQSAVSRTLETQAIKKKVYVGTKTPVHSGYPHYDNRVLGHEDDEYPWHPNYTENWKKENVKTASNRDKVDSFVKGADGQWRSKEEEEARLARVKKASAFNKKRTGNSIGEVIDPEEDVGSEDLSRLSWLNSPSLTPQDRFVQIAMARTGSESDNNRPLSPTELKYKLTLGCSCCGTEIDWRDDVELTRVRWWSRDAYACGDCYENVGGESDWVSYTIDGGWPVDIKKVTPIPNKEKAENVTVH